MRQGIRGGTAASREEGAVVQELHQPDVVATIDAAIWAVLRRKGSVHADDLVDVPIPADSVNVIGNRINHFARKGWTAAAAWRKAMNPASHGRISRVWGLTPEGQLELERRAGVGGGTTTSSSDYSAASHSGTDERQLDLALPHADTPQAGRPGHFDDWDVAT